MRRNVVAMGLAGTMLMSAVLTGCGAKKEEASQTSAEQTAAQSQAETAETAETETQTETEKQEDLEKPEKITVLYDMSLKPTQGLEKWVERWEELTGIELEMIVPDHDAYYDVMGQTFASGPDQWPDVVMTDALHYSGYAREGAFWDMTDAWNESELKASGNVDLGIVEANMIDGRLYGFSKERGNGCITYVKKSWLDRCGLSVPTNYEEYLNMLDVFTKGDPDGNGVNGDTYAVTAAGLIGAEAPYTNYLPEVYQDAYPSFYQKEDGTWVDGFTEDSMKAAIQRLQYVYQQGYLDKEAITNGTSDCRNKFYEDKCGVFTYWAGTWATSLKKTLESNGLSGELVALPPIRELGQYTERNSTVLSIMSSCENPEAVWKYFIESTCDGGDMQILWTYGVEGVHWSTKAEEVCGKSYEEGQFHMLENPESPDTQYTKVNTDPMLTVKPMDEDPGLATIEPEARASQELFNTNSKVAPLPVTTEPMSMYNGDLNTLKQTIIADCIMNGVSVEDGYKRFETEGGLEWSRMIVDSLNQQ